MHPTTKNEPVRKSAGQSPPRTEVGPAIRVEGLGKHYRSPWTLKITRGVEDLNFEVRRGEIMGYLGPNGAGKTTTLKLLMGLIRPTAGAAWLLGRSIDDPECRRKVGFLPEHPYFYDYLSGLEYLELAGGLSGLAGREATERAKHWLGRVGLGDRPRLVLRKYSKGMLQRLGLAAALVHEPELLVLDEPMSGLDPFGRRDVRELILEQRDRGVTVLFSSHILPDVEMLCDRVGIVLRGRLERVSPIGELMSAGAQTVSIRCAARGLAALPPEWANAVERRDRAGETELVVREPERADEVLRWVVQAGWPVLAVTPQRASLEELFLETAASLPGGAASADGGGMVRRTA